jgi:hypothetical protein
MSSQHVEEGGRGVGSLWWCTLTIAPSDSTGKDQNFLTHVDYYLQTAKAVSFGDGGGRQKSI